VGIYRYAGMGDDVLEEGQATRDYRTESTQILVGSRREDRVAPFNKKKKWHYHYNTYYLLDYNKTPLTFSTKAVDNPFSEVGENISSPNTFLASRFWMS
jgi:hypothetical protein